MAAEHVSERDPVSFNVGDSFPSYANLKDKIKQYEVERFVQLTHRDSRTLEMAKKRVPGRVACADKELVYYTIHFACVFGGKKYLRKGTGQRPNAYMRDAFKSKKGTSDDSSVEVSITCTYIFTM